MNFSSKVFWIQRSICDYTDSTNSLLCWSGDALGRRLSVCLSSLLPAAISVADIGMSWVQISGKPGSYLRKKFYCFWKGWDWKTCSLSAKYPDPWKIVHLLFRKNWCSLVPVVLVTFSVPSLHKRHTVTAGPVGHSLLGCHLVLLCVHSLLSPLQKPPEV